MSSFIGAQKTVRATNNFSYFLLHLVHKKCRYLKYIFENIYRMERERIRTILSSMGTSNRSVFGKTLETLSIRFFMAIRKPQNVTWPQSCCRVCSLSFTFERQEGLPAISDFWQGFLPLKIVQPRVDLMKNNMAVLDNDGVVKIRFCVPFSCTNVRKFSVPIKN